MVKITTPRGLGPLDPIWKGLLLAFFLIVLFASVSGAVEETAEFTDTMIKSFKDRFAAYEDRVWQAAMALFGLLFLCQFAWSVAQLCLHESLTFAAVISVVVRQVMTGMFFWWLLFDRSILKGIVGSFSQLAQSGLNLSELIFLMETAVQNIMSAVGKSSGIVEGISLFLSGLSASIVMSFALTTAIAYMAVVMVENYVVGSLGLILMGFGGSDYTRSYALSYIRTLVHIGLKLFLATIIVQVGVLAFTHATVGLSNMDAVSISQTCMRLMAQSFFFLAVTKVIPEVAGALVSGASTTGSHTANAILGTGRAAGAAVAGALAGAYHTPGSVADGYAKTQSAVEGAVNAYSSKFEQSMSKGRGPIVAGVSALGGTLWGAYQESRHRGGRWNRSAFENEMDTTPTVPQAPDPTKTSQTTTPISTRGPDADVDDFQKPNI
jgi:type IV secretion system protein TrbL